MTQYTTKAHIVRATLDAVAFQTVEIMQSMRRDTGIELKKLQVSGGMSNNSLLMQIQADLLGILVGTNEHFILFVLHYYSSGFKY